MTPSQKIKKRVLQELYSPGRVAEARLVHTVDMHEGSGDQIGNLRNHCAEFAPVTGGKLKFQQPPHHHQGPAAALRPKLSWTVLSRT